MKNLILLTFVILSFQACTNEEVYVDPLHFDQPNNQFNYVSKFTDPPVQYEYEGQLVRFEDGEGPSRECYHQAMQIVLIQATTLTHKSVLRILSNYHVGWYNKDIYSLYKGERYYSQGLSDSYWEYMKMNYNHLESHGLGQSTWVHEIGHAIQEKLGHAGYTNSNPDYDHKDQKIWDWVKETEKAVLDGTQNICPRFE